MAAKLVAGLLLVASLFQNVQSMTSKGRRGRGLIGYGIEMYKPPCAFACRDSIKDTVLNCTSQTMDHSGMGGMMMMEAETTPECYTSDDAFLQTLAYCMSVRCQDMPVWRLEKFWTMFVAGRNEDQPLPKETYQQALAKVNGTPTAVAVSKNPLNQTSLVSDDDYISNYNGDADFEAVEGRHEKYGIVLLVTGAAIPVAFSLLRFIPFPSKLAAIFNGWFIYPPAIGSSHSQAIFGLFHMPTRGQAFFIMYLIAINLALSFARLEGNFPNAWYETDKARYLDFLALRTGVLSFANLPLLILYSSRNNVLLYLTNWSHGTFLLLHRYVAWICTLQAVVHSILELRAWIKNGGYGEEVKLAYWIWGAVATLGLSIMIPCAMYPLRRKFYEIFLVWHQLLAVFVVVGCYYHIICRFQHQWGYETWIYVAIAVWAFERAMRLLRLARNGLKTAQVTVVDSDYVRVDVPGVSGSGHAYLYFPTLTWRIWENHPFSVASSVLATSENDIRKHVTATNDEKSGVLASTKDAIDSQSETSSTAKPAGKIGLTFVLRGCTGLTAKIRNHVTLPVFVESPYGPHQDFSGYNYLLCIVGGVGITTVVPYLRAHPTRAKLFWAVRSHGIVDDLAPSLVHVDKEVFVGKGNRMDISRVLEKELLGLDGQEKAVVLCSGPHAMADEVRLKVAELARRGVDVRLVVEAFSW